MVILKRSLFIIFFIFSVIFFTLITYPYVDYSKRPINSPSDFLSFMVGANIVKDGKVRFLYDYNLEKEYQQKLYPQTTNAILAFKLPPVMAYLYLPLAFLSPSTAFYVHITANLLFLIASIFLLNKIAKLPENVFLLNTSFILLFGPLWVTLAYGQSSILILFITLLSFFFLQRRRFFLSGFLSTLILLKPTFLLLILIMMTFAFFKDRKGGRAWIKGLLLSGVLMLILNMAAYGVNVVRDYPKTLITGEDPSYGILAWENFNPVSIYYSFIKNDVLIRKLALVTDVLLFIPAIWLGHKLMKKGKELLAFGLLTTLSPLLNIHTMPCDLSLLVIGLYLISGYLYTKLTDPFLRFALLLWVPLFYFTNTWLAAFDIQYLGTIGLLGFSFFMLGAESLN